MGIINTFQRRGWTTIVDHGYSGYSDITSWGWGSYATHAGQRVDRTSAMTLAVVYGCVSLLANRIACMPVDIIGGSGPLEFPPRWVDNPSPEMSRSDLVSCMVMSLLLDGNAFIAVRRQRGRPIELALLDPVRVSMLRRDGDITVQLDGIDFKGEIVIVRHIVMPGEIRGLPPIGAAKHIIGLGLGAQQQAATFFSKGAVSPGVIQTEGEVTADQMREIRNQWVDTHGGTQNAHLPVVMGRAKWQPVAITNEQAQFLETRKFTDAQICSQIFHIDPTLMGVGIEGRNLTYQNVESRNRQLLHDALMPIMVRLEEALSKLLPSNQKWKFNVDSLLRADLTSRYQSYQIAAQIEQMLGRPLMTVEEMRELEDLPNPPNGTANPMTIPMMPNEPEPEDIEADEPAMVG